MKFFKICQIRSNVGFELRGPNIFTYRQFCRTCFAFISEYFCRLSNFLHVVSDKTDDLSWKPTLEVFYKRILYEQTSSSFGKLTTYDIVCRCRTDLLTKSDISRALSITVVTNFLNNIPYMNQKVRTLLEPASPWKS